MTARPFRGGVPEVIHAGLKCYDAEQRADMACADRVRVKMVWFRACAAFWRGYKLAAERAL